MSTTPEPPATPTTPLRAFLLSLVCPGLGEWYSGYRGRALLLIVGFALAAVWLLTGAYGTVNALAVEAVQKHPELQRGAEEGGVDVGLVLRLYRAIHAEVMANYSMVQVHVTYPLTVILGLYLFSLIEAPLLARTASGPAAPPAPTPPAG